MCPKPQTRLPLTNITIIFVSAYYWHFQKPTKTTVLVVEGRFMETGLACHSQANLVLILSLPRAPTSPKQVLFTYVQPQRRYYPYTWSPIDSWLWRLALPTSETRSPPRTISSRLPANERRPSQNPKALMNTGSFLKPSRKSKYSLGYFGPAPVSSIE